MATENKKYIPALRFPEFQNDGEWKEYPLGQIFSRITKRNSVNNQNVLTISAQYGLISQYDYFNKNVAAIDVSNYYHISKYDFAYNKSKSQGYPYGAIKPLKLYEDGVVSPLYICFRIKDDQSFVNTFFEYYFESGLIHKEIDKISQEGARNHGLLNISTKDFFDKIILYIPSFLEQKKIADCFVSIDKEIDATKCKLDLLKEHKKGLMQRLFPAKGKTIPELRFPEFQNDEEWRRCTTNEIFSRITRKNTINNQNVLTISAQYGLISQYEYFNKNVAAADVSNYYLIDKHDFAYNKSRSLGYPYGAIKPLKMYDQGVVSPLYICFRIKDDVQCSNTFFEYYFESELIHKEIQNMAQEGARNHGLLNISTEDFFNKIQLYIPSFVEQKKIADCLSSLEDIIMFYEDEILELEHHRKGLMQQLFPKL